MSAAAITPRVRAMLFCNRVRESAREGEVFDLKGVRRHLTADAFPFRLRHLAAFLVLTSPRAGRFPGHIRITEVATDRVIYQYEFEAVFDGENDTVYPTTPLNCKFDRPGQYTMSVWFFRHDGADVQKAEDTFHVLLEGE